MKLDCITDPKRIAELIPEVRRILDEGYLYFLGSKWHGTSSNRKLRETTTVIKFAYDENGRAACAIYINTFGGNKLVGLTGVPSHPKYKNGAVEIIKSDISGFRNWYWVEASGAIEHYFKKHGGYPIPCQYAKLFIGRPIKKEESDGFHYIRELGQEHELVRKCVFGFPSEEAYNEVVKNFSGYEEFRERIIGEGVKYSDRMWARNIIGSIEEMNEYDVNELPPRWEADLKRAVKLARRSGDERVAETGELLLQIMPPLELIYIPH